jgi:ATP-dependent DNA helicase RecQ
LRPVDYKAAGTLQRSVDAANLLGRDGFDDLLDAMVRARLVQIEEAEYEKDGEVRRYRKVRLTPAGLDVRSMSPLALLISDGVVDDFSVRAGLEARVKSVTTRSKRAKKPAPLAAQPQPTPESEDLALKLKEWRAAEAKRLGVPAYVVLHDRALNALALFRPANPNQLLAIDGIGPAKVEKFGRAILCICGSAQTTTR